MSEPGELPPHGFEDLVPWADPYIAALIEKLRHADDEYQGPDIGPDILDELPPPLDNNDEDSQLDWRTDRLPREPQE